MMTSRLSSHLLALQPLVCCPRCDHDLEIQDQAFHCTQCETHYPSIGQVPCLLTDLEASKQHWRKQLWQIHREAELTRELFQAEMRKPGLISVTRHRLSIQIELTDRVIGEFDDIVVPIIGTPIPTEQPLPAYQLLENFHYLFRDWGWPCSNENVEAFKLVSSLINAPIDTLLVVASGASRLAYDIASANLAAKVIALDIDPLLLAMSEKICAGETHDLTETRSNATELSQMSITRKLEAQNGAVTVIHPLLANGLSVPLKSESVDAVLVPWFTDLVGDFRQFIRSLDSVLKQEGAWYHYGPLLYPTSVPASLRFSREEIFELLKIAGYEIEDYAAGSANFSCSPLTGRGRIEPVFSFRARKKNFSSPKADLPAWLILPYLPIPDFSARMNFHHSNPAYEAIIKLIDGDRSLLDLAECIRALIGSFPEDLVDSIRYCLSECHPECHLHLLE